MAQLSVLAPDQESYRKKRNGTVNSTLPPSSKLIIPVERVELHPDHGYLLYKKGMKHPTKGLVYPEALKGINTAKRVLMVFFWSMQKPIFWPTLILFLFSRNKMKKIEHMLEQYQNAVINTVQDHFLDHDKMTPVAREVEKFITVFLKVLRINDTLSENIAAIVASMFEYDDAYRYRLQDIASETSKLKLLGDLPREATKLITIYASREESKKMIQDFKVVMVFLKYFLKLNKDLKFAFDAALHGLDFEKLQYDEIDSYNILLKAGYDYKGKTYEERYAEFLIMHDGIQPECYVID